MQLTTQHARAAILAVSISLAMVAALFSAPAHAAAPTVSIDAITDGGDAEVSPYEADAGIDVTYTVSFNGRNVQMAVANTGDLAPASCTFNGLRAGTDTVSVSPDCFSALADGDIVVTVSAEDADGNPGSAAQTLQLDRLLGVSVVGAEDGVVNGDDSAAGTAFGVLLAPDAVLGNEVLTAVVTVSDGTDSVVSDTVELAASSSTVERTVSMDVSSLDEGDLVVDAVVTSSLGDHKEQVEAKTDVSGPLLDVVAEDGVRLWNPVAFLTFNCCTVSTASLEGTSQDAVSPIQFVYVEAVNEDTGLEINRPAAISHRLSRSVNWSTSTNDFEPGNWTVVVSSQDLAGNVTVAPPVTLVVEGL